MNSLAGNLQIREANQGLNRANFIAVMSDVESPQQCQDLADIDLGEHPDKKSHYAVAEQNGLLIAIMTLKPASEVIRQRFSDSQEPGEVGHAYVHHNHRHEGVGHYMFEYMSDVALELGYSDLFVMSADKYKKWGAWVAWDLIMGNPAADLDDVYGPGTRALVWRRQLATPKAELTVA